jgi:hypothetical protein
MARKPLPSSTKRGYGQAHRRGYAAQKEQQWGRPCCRCGHEMIRGQDIQKDHLDDRSGYFPTWSHRRCNVAASNKRRAELRRAQGFIPRRRRVSRRHDTAPAQVEPQAWVIYQRQHSRNW